MTPKASVIAAIDAGTATTSVALIGRLEERWRLLGSVAAPAGVSEVGLIGHLAAELARADPLLATALRVDLADPERIATMRSATTLPPTLAVLAGSPRALAAARGLAAGSGWRIVGAQPETHDPRDVTALLLRPDVSGVLIAASDPPGADERASLDDLSAVAAAARLRRSGLPVILAGSMATRRRRFDRLGLDDDADSTPVIPIPRSRGADLGVAVRAALETLRGSRDDGRSGIVAAAAGIAAATDRRVEVIDVGLRAGLRVVADPPLGGKPGRRTSHVSVDGGLVPDLPDDAAVDGVLAWASRWGDRLRVADRMHDLRLRPWADTDDIGARLRLAAAAAAIERLVAGSPELSAGRPADLVILAGGAFALAPPAAVALTAADVLRRPGAIQLVLDHARLLGPVGHEPDPGRRAKLLRDLADDLLLPLGSLVVVPATARTVGAPPTHVDVTADGLDLALDIGPGTIELVDLGPGVEATATIETPAPRRLGGRARRVAIDVSGGLAGLLLDGRGFPLRLPTRGDDRRAALAAWHDPLWGAG